MNILGISALYHDAAAALVTDGKIIAAAQEERFTRIKHDASMPAKAMAFCLHQGNLQPKDLDYIVFYDNPLLTLDRYMKNILALGTDAEDLLCGNFGNMFGRRLWWHEQVKDVLGWNNDCKAKFMVCKHHISHAASAFFPSPYESSLILTLDGVGEWMTLSTGIGKGNKLSLEEEIRYPHSLGMLYSAFTYFCGFKVNSGDYKFMGLAPYGEPVYYDLIKKEIIDVKEDGSFRLNLHYFDFYKGRTMINESALADLFGGGRRWPESRITKREMDIAASVQKVTEEVILKIVSHIRHKYAHAICGSDNLVLAGGVALNCVANGKILRESGIKNIWIQPAAGDAGGALGAALYVYYQLLGHERKRDGINDIQQGSYLGPVFAREEIKSYLDYHGYRYHETDNMPKEVAGLLAAQKIIGLFQGRMEFGPRALGNRSIIADPRAREMQSRLNLKIKFRESFRPFAPSVLKERLTDYFELDKDSPYMLLCASVRAERRVPFVVGEVLEKAGENMLQVVQAKRSDIPAVTHVDYSARIQSVDGKENPRYYAVIKEFEKLTGCGVIVNTSFNVRGEPIVCSPQDAYRCFMRSNIDVLVMEDFILYREEQPVWQEDKDWRQEYELD